MTVEMAEIMIRVKSMRPRAERLIDAVLPHAIALGETELEQQMQVLKEMIKIQESMKVSWLSALRTKKS